MSNKLLVAVFFVISWQAVGFALVTFLRLFNVLFK